jgi:hypothetical protein
MAGRSTKRALLIAEESQEAARLKLQGKTVREIAEALELSVRTARDRIRRGVKWWQDRSAEAAGAWIAQELACAEMLFVEAFAAWRRSIEPAELTRVRDGPKGRVSLAQREKQAGDPALLAECRHLRERIAALKGLDAPKRSELSGPAGSPIPLNAITPENVHEFSETELVAFISEVRAILRACGRESVGDLPGAPLDVAVHPVHVSGLPGELAPPDPGQTP